MIIKKPCRFRHADGTIEHFQPGQAVPKELQDHWFLAAHSDKPPKIVPPKGSVQFEREARRRVMEEMEKARDAKADPDDDGADGDGAQDGGASADATPQPRPRKKTA